MAIEFDDRELADALNHPEGGERHQKAKVEFNYRQLNAQTKATKAQLEAIEVQKKAAEAEAKAAEASIITAKATERAAEATERNAKYLLWSVIIAAIAALFSAVSTGLSLWNVVHPR